MLPVLFAIYRSPPGIDALVTSGAVTQCGTWKKDRSHELMECLRSDDPEVNKLEPM